VDLFVLPLLWGREVNPTASWNRGTAELNLVIAEPWTPVFNSAIRHFGNRGHLLWLSVSSTQLVLRNFAA
jgi:hypothetical protein